MEIIAADIPGLFKHFPNPGESFMRKVMVAVQEFERDVVVTGLLHGLESRRKDMEARVRSNGPGARTTQTGKAKVNGRCSVLEHIKPSGRVLRSLQFIRKKTLATEMSWRRSWHVCS